MPRIPMADKAGMIQHVNGAVHMQGAPGLNWKLEEGQSLINMGDKIGRGMERLGNSLTEYFKQKQDTEDKLNATQIESIWRDKQSALLTRMAQNPADYEKFAEWARETDADFADAAKPYREKMSSRALELFDARMDGIRKETYNTRERVGIQAGVTADYNLFQSQCKDAGLRGDMEKYNELLEAHRGKLISEAEYQQKRLDYDRLSAYGEVKRQVDADAPGIIGRLKERDKDGNYVNYTGLAAADRDRFIRVAEANEAKKEFKEIQEFNAGIVSGTLEVSQKDLDEKKAKGLLNDRLYLAMSATVQARDKEAVRLMREKERTERSAKQRADAVNQSKFKLYVQTMDFSSNPEENTFQKRMALDTLLKSFPGDYKFQGEMIDYIDKRSGEVELKRKIFKTPQGQIAKKWLETNVKQMYYDPAGLGNMEDGTEFQRSREAEASDMMADLLQHGKSADEAIRAVEELVKRMNEGEIYHLYRWRTPGWKPKGKRITKEDLEKEEKGKPVFSDPGLSIFPVRSVYIPKQDHSKDVMIDDIVSKKTNAYGREMWKLKDGRTVYADEYE